MEDKTGGKRPILRKPRWLYTTIESGEKYGFVEETLEMNHLHTICSSGKCPNKGHCWKMGTATFMILATDALALAGSVPHKRGTLYPRIPMNR